MNKIRFFLMKDYANSIYYYWDNGLKTVTNATIATVTNKSVAEAPSPVNWAETEMKWDRDTQMMGLFSSISTNFEFIGKAASILSNLYITQGVQAVCYLRIQILGANGVTGAYSYSDLYVANIDFSTIGTDYFTDGSGTITISTIYNDLTEILKAWGSTEYNVPMWYYDNNTNTQILDPDAVNIYNDGVKVTAEFNFVSANGYGGQQTVSGSIGTVPSVTTSWLLTPLTNVQPATPYFGNEIIGNNVLIGTQQNDLSTGNTQVWQHSNYILRVLDYEAGSSLPITGYLSGPCIINGTYAFGSVFTASILGISNDNVIRYMKVVYQKTINNNDDTYFFFEDPTGGHGGTVPTVKSGVNNQSSIDISSFPAGSAQATDGLMYVLAFNISGSPVGNAYSLNFASGSSTTYPFGTLTPTPIRFNSNGPVRYPSSGTLGFRYKDVWKKIVQVMAATQGNEGFPVAPVGTPYTGVSNFLSNPAISPISNYDNIPYQTICTSGNALRMFQDPTNPGTGFNFLSITCNDVINDMMRRWQMGIGVEGNNLRAEPLSYWFDNTTMIADLTGIAITNFSWKPFTQYMGNQVQVGYNSQSFNEIGALDDYNLSLLFRVPITRILNKIDWTCPFNASIYQIEKARANQQANDTQVDPTDSILTDAEQDNSTFIEEIDTTTTNSPTVYSATPVACYNLKRYSFGSRTTSPASSGMPSPSVSGLTYPDTAFNLGLTGKKNLLRNGPLLASICYPQSSASILFQKADHTGRLKTDKLESNLYSGRIIEYADVPVSSLPTPLFLPILFTFDSPQPVNLFQIMNSNPRGYIKFKWQGNIYKGFIWEAGIHPGNNSLFSFQLLATPDTDVSKLQLA